MFCVGDLAASFSDERQKIALGVLKTHFAKVMTFDEVREELGRLVRKT